MPSLCTTGRSYAAAAATPHQHHQIKSIDLSWSHTLAFGETATPTTQHNKCLTPHSNNLDSDNDDDTRSESSYVLCDTPHSYTYSHTPSYSSSVSASPQSRCDSPVYEQFEEEKLDVSECQFDEEADDEVQQHEQQYDSYFYSETYGIESILEEDESMEEESEEVEDDLIHFTSSHHKCRLSSRITHHSSTATIFTTPPSASTRQHFSNRKLRRLSYGASPVSTRAQSKLTSDLRVLSQSCSGASKVELKKIQSSSGVVKSPYDMEERQEELEKQWMAQEGVESDVEETEDGEIESRSSPPLPLKSRFLRPLQSHARNLPSHIRRLGQSSLPSDRKWSIVLQVRQIKKALVKQRLAAREDKCNRFSKKLGSKRQTKYTSEQRCEMNRPLTLLKTARTTAVVRQMTPDPRHLMESWSLASEKHKLETAKTMLTAGKRWLNKLNNTSHNNENQEADETSEENNQKLVRKSSSSSSLSTHPHRRARTSLSPFERFRRNWYYSHRSQIESSLDPTRGTKVIGVRKTSLFGEITDAFMGKAKSLGCSSTMLTFHGTNPANWASIQRYGFLIPGITHAHGVNISVSNGASCGRGVYSATTAAFSLNYIHYQETGTMFVCAILTTRMSEYPPYRPVGARTNYKPESVKQFGQQVVTYDESRILPLFFMDFASCDASKATARASILSRALEIRMIPLHDKLLTRPKKDVVPIGVRRNLLKKIYTAAWNEGKKFKSHQMETSNTM